MRQRRRVVGAVSDHCDELAVGLLLADVSELRLGRALRDEVINACFLRDCRGGERIVARYHDAAHAHPAQTLQALADAGFQNIGEYDDTDDSGAIGDCERCSALPANRINCGLEFGWSGTGLTLDEAYYGLRCALANLTAIGKIDPAHPRLCGERNELCAVWSGYVGRGSTPIKVESYDRLSFGRLIGD